MSLLAKLNRKITDRFPVKLVKNKAGRPVASLSFDDFPRTAWTVGGPILARHGVLATYYTVGSFCGQTVDGVEQYQLDDLRAVAAAGHEIASHTFCHRAVYDSDDAALMRDEAANDAFFRQALGDYRATSFAYPFGEASVRTKSLFGELYPTSRGIVDGVNAGWMDLAQLKACGIEKKHWSRARIEDQVAEAVERQAWLIFFTHDISADPTPYGATPQMLEHAIETLKAKGVEILTVKAALAATQF